YLAVGFDVRFLRADSHAAGGEIDELAHRLTGLAGAVPALDRDTGLFQIVPAVLPTLRSGLGAERADFHRILLAVLVKGRHRWLLLDFELGHSMLISSDDLRNPLC